MLVERRIPLAVPAQSTQPRQGARKQKLLGNGVKMTEMAKNGLKEGTLYAS